jgi:hypothetical protein
MIADAFFSLMRFEKGAVCIGEVNVWLIQRCRWRISASPIQSDVRLKGAVVELATSGASQMPQFL